MRFRILGPLAIERNGQELEIGGHRQRALLGRLLLDAGRCVPSDRLIEEFWGEDASQAARKRLQVSVSRLRRALHEAHGDGVPPVIVSISGGYMARLELGQLDLHEFERMVEDGRRALGQGDMQRAAVLLADAERLWRGPPLSDVALGLEATPEIARLEELRIAAIEDGVEARLALGLEREVIPDLELLAAQHPLRERLWGQLMLALYRIGRQAEALDAYQRVRRRLSEDLGLQPGPALGQLERQILNHDPVLLATAAAPITDSPAVVQPRRAPPSPVLPASRSSTTFVGRTEEMRRLGRALESTTAGSCRLVLLEGEAGIGKTRLALRFGDRCCRAGALVLYGRSDSETFVPYQPFVEALRRWLDPTAIARLTEVIPSELRELSRVLPELGTPSLPPTAPEEPAERYRLFDAMSVLLDEISHAQPALLVLDDLHWADKPTLLMLRQVVRSRRTAPMLILGTYRPTEVDEDVRETVADLRRDHVIERISLAGLARNDAANLITELSVGVLPEPIAGTLWKQTRGNPFFLEEMMRDRASSVREDTAQSAEHGAVPDAVKDVIGRRLERVSDRLRKVLAIAAVAGSGFPLGLLEELSGLSEETLHDVIDEGIAAHLIVVPAGAVSMLAFEHSLTRQTLLEGLTRTRRAWLHLQVGEWLERQGPDQHGQRLAELAHHFSLAPPERGLAKTREYAQRAARHALDTLAFEDAVRYYEVALNAIERLGDAENAHEEVLLALASAQAKAGDTATARKSFRRVAAIARSRGSARGLTAAALGLGFSGHVLRATVDHEIVSLLREALRALGSADPGLRSRLLSRLAIELGFSEKSDERAAISEEAVRLARNTDDPAALGSALLAQHWSLWDPRSVSQRLMVAKELLALGEGANNPKFRLEAHRWLMIDLLELGDISGVDRQLAAFTLLAEERGRASEQWTAHLYRAMRFLMTGQFDDAEAASRRALELGTRAGDRNAYHGHFLQMAALARDRGTAEDLVHAIRQRVDRSPAALGWRCLLACYLADLDDVDATRDEINDLVPASIPRNGLWLGAIAHLAEAVAAVGDRPRSAELYEMLRPFADQTVAIVWASTCAGSASRPLGALAASLQRRDDAARHFEDALRVNQDLGAKPALARTQVEYSKLLLSGTANEHTRGNELAAQGTATAKRLGMARLTQQGRKLLEAAL